MTLMATADAQMDPWCTVPLWTGTEVLFGYAVKHPLTGGMSWVVSTQLEALEPAIGRARTRSGRVYDLGRRIELKDIPSEGDEAWIAYELLIGGSVADPFAVPRRATRLGADSDWLAACKAARHLGVPAPKCSAIEIVSQGVV